MSEVGKNDPCRCGSGRKFKRCCLAKKALSPQFYTSTERVSAAAKLMRFCERQEFRENYMHALLLFWGDRWSSQPGEELARVMASESSEAAFHYWFLFDFDSGRGRRLLDAFLEREGSKLTSGERRYLEGMSDSHLRSYEVLRVKFDEGFELRDLWNNRRLWVRERQATRQIIQWDVIVGRTTTASDGVTVFETVAYVFPALIKDELVALLKKAHRAWTAGRGDDSITRFFKAMAPVFHQEWLQRVALRPGPRLVTSDGEPFLISKVVFELLDRECAARLLAEHPELVDHGNGRYGWVVSRGTLKRSLGVIAMERRRLVFETTSQGRAERGRDFLKNFLGASVKFKAISYEDPYQAIKRSPASAKREPAEIPADVRVEALGRYYEEHYRKWLDEPVPALGNRTPRHAARLKTVRPRLVALLKDFESSSERQRRAGEVAYDFGWMWKELGLRRE